MIAIFILFPCSFVIIIWFLKNKENSYKKSIIEELINNYGIINAVEMNVEKQNILRKDFHKKRRDNTLFIDDMTWNDFNIDQIYNAINSTGSSMGEIYLYGALLMKS